MKRITDNHKWWAIVGTGMGIVIIGAGLFFYHNFFRQSNAKLIETVPPDASFIFQLNDNETFVKTSTALLPYLNELFAMDALAGFEFFIDKFPEKNPQIIISGHQNSEKNVLLFSTKIDERTFKTLLNTLHIDPRNFISFDEAKIYTYGTHFKRFNFAYHGNILSVSEEVELLKKSLVQLKHPRNLLSNKDFMYLFKLVEKNTKQNWLIINNHLYFENIPSKLATQLPVSFNLKKNIPAWSAYQIRFSDKEIKLSGYSINEGTLFHKFKDQPTASGNPTKILPLNLNYYIAIRTPDYKLFMNTIKDSDVQYPANEIEEYKLLQPAHSFYFSLTKDTVMYHYLAVKTDTNNCKLSDIIAEDQTADSIIYFSKQSIYKSKLKNFNTLLSTLHNKVSMQYFTVNNDYCIFSDTPGSLQYYITQLTQGSIENNPQYKFSVAGLPTENNYEFFYYSNDEIKTAQYFTKDASKAEIVKKINILSLSFSTHEREFIPTNIYIKFR